MNKNKGFTLIELLVVIAIIGILSSVVLASLGTARNKGKTAAVKAAMAQVRSQAELYYDSNGSYGDITTAAGCTTGLFADAQVTAILANVTANNGGNPNTCTSNNATGIVDTAYAMSTTLVDGTLWCIDSVGTAKVGAAQATGKC